MTVPAHDRVAAARFAKGLATWQLCGIRLSDPDPRRRFLATVALGLRHPIYAQGQ